MTVEQGMTVSHGRVPGSFTEPCPQELPHREVLRIEEHEHQGCHSLKGLHSWSFRSVKTQCLSFAFAYKSPRVGERSIVQSRKETKLAVS